jgi:hypothetical protein
MIGGVGQRMLTSVSRRMAGEFFGSLEQVITGVAPVAEPAQRAAAPTAPAAAAPGVFTAPPRPASGGQQEFLRGVAVGAGLVTLGVLLGSRLGRRR